MLLLKIFHFCMILLFCPLQVGTELPPANTNHLRLTPQIMWLFIQTQESMGDSLPSQVEKKASMRITFPYSCFS